MSIAVISEVESEHFGVTIARATVHDVGEIGQALEHCRVQEIDLLVARCSTDDIELAQELETLGFRLMDTLLFFERGVAEDLSSDDGIAVRSATSRDIEAVAAIATEAFGDYSGHYQADRRIPRDLADSGYVDWAIRSCRSRQAAEEVLVAEREGGVAGFVAVRRISDAADVALLATAAAARGQGVGRALMGEALRWTGRQNLPRLTFSTQLNNLRSQQMIVRLGFVPVRSFYTFHWWRT